MRVPNLKTVHLHVFNPPVLRKEIPPPRLQLARNPYESSPVQSLRLDRAKTGQSE